MYFSACRKLYYYVCSYSGLSMSVWIEDVIRMPYYSIYKAEVVAFLYYLGSYRLYSTSVEECY